MGRNIKNIVRKYRLLPGFLQERAFFDFYTKTREELGEVEALVFAEEMFEATKTKYKPNEDNYVFTPPIYCIGFFDLGIDFSPYIESGDDFKYDVCSLQCQSCAWWNRCPHILA